MAIATKKEQSFKKMEKFTFAEILTKKAAKFPV